MPNYTHAAYLPASIGAILKQIRPADEIIIVDDASTDGSLAVIDQLTLGHTGVRIIRNSERGGVVRALQAGLAAARGELVAFLGADDRVNPNFLSTTAALLEAHPGAAFACGRAEVLDGNDQLLAERPIVRPSISERFVGPAEAKDQLRKADNFFLGAVTLYRRSPLEELGGFDEALGPVSDGLVQRRMAVRWGYAFTPAVLGVWRIHGANYSVTSATDLTKLEHSIAVSKAVLTQEPAGLFPAGYADLFERRLRFNGARLIVGKKAQPPEVRETICRVIAGSGVDRAALAAAAYLGPLYWLCVMTWLFIRLRPFALSWLVGEAAIRLKDRMRRAF